MLPKSITKTSQQHNNINAVMVIRHPTETMLARVTILFASINFCLLIWQQIEINPAWQIFIFDLLFNTLLLLAGWCSLRKRRSSLAQPLAAAWMFTPLVGARIIYSEARGYDFSIPFDKPELVNAMMVLAFFIVCMNIWSIALAIRHSRLEIKKN
jgi:hypothetical protein